MAETLRQPAEFPDQESSEFQEAGKERPSFLTLAEQARFEQLLAEVEGRPPVEDIIEAEFTELLPEQQRQIVALEVEYNDRRDEIKAVAANRKLQLLGRAVLRVAKFFDLDTKDKLMTAALEIIPYVGLGYAIFGKRVIIDRDPQTQRRSISFEDISVVDRVIYLIGEALASGHALRGALNSLKREGVKKVMLKAGQEVAQNTGKLLVTRGRRGLERELGGLLPGKNQSSGTREESQEFDQNE